jgi:hypothetical protein
MMIPWVAELKKRLLHAVACEQTVEGFAATSAPGQGGR